MERQAEYGITKSDIGELQQMQAVTWERNALVFNAGLDQATIDNLAGGLTKFSEGYQTYWGDFWQMLEVSGYEWTDYVPEQLAFNTANNWRRMVQRFPVDVRLAHKHLKASHYIEANHRKLSDEQANQLLNYADEYGWTVEMVRVAVKEAIGMPEPVKKPKLTTCQHCDHWIADIEDEGCPWCMFDVAEKRIEDYRAVLTEIANPSGDLDWAAGLADRVLTDV